MDSKISILGGGSWGTAIGILLSKKGKDVSLWIRNEEQYGEVFQKRVNSKYLPDIKLPNNLNILKELKEAVVGCEIIVLAVPTSAVRELLEKISDYISETAIIVNLAKGIEVGTLYRVSEISKEILPENSFVSLSGPSHAEEVAIDIPTAVVSASEDLKLAEYIQDIFMAPNFRVYTNKDLIGVELGAALKNIIALGAGIADGLGHGDNTKAALMTRGITEMGMLGEKMGANLSTFWGLSGIGDLIVTCTSMHSRNRRAGILIGEGKTKEEAMEEVGMVVESIKTTKSVYKLSKQYDIDLPITEEIYKILYENIDVNKSVLNLMERDKKHEMENLLF